MRKEITLNELKKTKLENDKEKIDSEIEKAEKFAKQVSEFHPATSVFTVDEEDGKLYYQYFNTRLEHPTLKIRISYNDYSKKYSVFCEDIQKIKNTNGHTIQQARQTIEAPKNIGVLTAKKIQDWIQYEEKIYNAVFEVGQENTGVKERFKESIKGLDVRYWDNGKKGEIVKNGIKFIFTEEDGYFSTRMEIYFEVETTIGNFKKLSDNKYKSKK